MRGKCVCIRDIATTTRPNLFKMIANKSRESRRSKVLRMPKNLQRLYKEGKCGECSVVVTRMDFAKILGKFTKVKIQYESSANTRSTRTNTPKSPPNSRLKSNENSMVLLHRNAYSQHPAKTATAKKAKANNTLKEITPQQEKNVLRESNRPRKTPMKDKNANNKKTVIANKNKNFKQYGIVFINPKNSKNDFKNKLTLTDLLPNISKDILPSEEWHVDYFPKDSEPKDDKVYDRIAAELEDLMYNDDKPIAKSDHKPESKTDDFPSIMDILNDSTTSLSQKEGESSSMDPKTSLESNDVEAMLLGKTSEKIEFPKPTSMEVDPADVTNLLADVAQLTEAEIGQSKLANAGETMDLDNPNSPSILDEATDKVNNDSTQSINDNEAEKTTLGLPISKDPISPHAKKDSKVLIPNNVTHVIFRKSINGKCEKSVTCPKNLKYSVELEGKSVEFLGAPKFISSIEDLEVLLQIVNESQLKNLYVLH